MAMLNARGSYEGSHKLTTFGNRTLAPMLANGITPKVIAARHRFLLVGTWQGPILLPHPTVMNFLRGQAKRLQRLLLATLPWCTMIVPHNQWLNDVGGYHLNPLRILSNDVPMVR